MRVPIFLLWILLAAGSISAGSYENTRCRCICGSLNSLFNKTGTVRVYTGAITPNMCSCEKLIVDELGADIEELGHLICLRCECKFETRNTTMIIIVVLFIIIVLIFISLYMGFLLCLYPMMHRNRVKPYINIRHRRTIEERRLLLVEENLDDLNDN